jgi:single-strand selective monofunctional uracil DNA glycosylase
MNYCPLLLLDTMGGNITPDRISLKDREDLARVCDSHLCSVVDMLHPRWLVGIGRFAEDRLKALQLIQGWRVSVLGIPHPSPASPLANRDWAGKTTSMLKEAGIW